MTYLPGDLPPLNAEARAFVREITPGAIVSDLARYPDKLVEAIYGVPGIGVIDLDDALAHVEGDIADLKSTLADKERQRAAILIRKGMK